MEGADAKSRCCSIVLCLGCVLMFACLFVYFLHVVTVFSQTPSFKKSRGNEGRRELFWGFIFLEFGRVTKILSFYCFCFGGGGGANGE